MMRVALLAVLLLPSAAAVPRHDIVYKGIVVAADAKVLNARSVVPAVIVTNCLPLTA